MRVRFFSSLEKATISYGDAKADGSPNHNGQEGQASDTSVHVIQSLEDDRVGLKKKVIYSVRDGKVEADEENDGFVNGHTDRSHKSDRYHLPSAFLFELDSCEYIDIFRFFAHTFCSLLQDDWSISLGHETDGYKRGSNINQTDPKRPPPRNDGDKA